MVLINAIQSIRYQYLAFLCLCSGNQPRSAIPEMHNGVSMEKDVYESQGNVFYLYPSPQKELHVCCYKDTL